MFHYLHNVSLDDQHFDDFFHSHKSSACLISSVSDYDLGGVGDLFKAPQPIIETPLVTLDRMTSSMSTILFGEDLINSQEAEFTNIESPQNENSISSIFHELEDILANELSSPSQSMNSDGIVMEEENSHPVGKITKSVSSYCLASMDCTQTRPTSVSDTEMKGHGMRRAFSEGCIKPQLINDHITEARMQKLSRYREKKTKRNFKRKVKYACRKALADSQPRIGGRFAKKEETNVFEKVIRRL